MPIESDTVDVDRFFTRPLTAHVASITSEGPRVRPVWFLWEDGSFWILSGAWSALRCQIEDDDRVSIVVDVADLESGEVIQVIAIGRADVRRWTSPAPYWWGKLVVGVALLAVLQSRWASHRRTVVMSVVASAAVAATFVLLHSRGSAVFGLLG